MSDETLTLYRPVGLREMELILQADSKAFPPRLPHQPIFYPVLNFEYAEQIARDWNTKDEKSGFAGFVTEFEVDKVYASQFEIHTVGGSTHRELWVRAEELATFNQHIRGGIQLKAAYYSEGYKGIKHRHMNWYADEMFEKLYITAYLSSDFYWEIIVNRNAIFLNFSYWATHDMSRFVLYEGEQTRFLKKLEDIWKWRFPDIPLLGSDLLK